MDAKFFGRRKQCVVDAFGFDNNEATHFEVAFDTVREKGKAFHLRMRSTT
jgi:hypothetical protein